MKRTGIMVGLFCLQTSARGIISAVNDAQQDRTAMIPTTLATFRTARLMQTEWRVITRRQLNAEIIPVHKPAIPSPISIDV